MIRKMYSALALMTVAGMVLVGCGKEDLSELDSTWGKKEGDVMAKLTELQAKNEELTAKFETVKAVNVADTVKAADRALVDQMLKDHLAATGEIEKTTNDLKAKREDAMKSGKKADYEAAWKDAEAQYEGALKRIDELQSQNGEIAGKIDGLSGSATMTVPVDTAVMNSAGAKVDSVKAANGVKAESKKPAETVGNSTAGTATTVKAESNSKGIKIEKNTNPGEAKKPLIQKNTNP